MADQRGVFRRSQALAAGHGRPDFERLVRAGAWVAMRHGIYTTRERYDEAQQQPVATLLLAAAARRLAITGDTLLSHTGAAFAHGATLLDDLPAEPTLTLHRAGPERQTAHGLYVARVPPEHRVRTSPMTTFARAVADCARTLTEEAAFVTIESALHAGLDRDEIFAVLQACAGWPGSAAARVLVDLAGPWSESPLESLSRLMFLAQRLPRPEQQLTILRVGGGFIARVDFLWEQFRTVCEVDGKIKYGKLAYDGTLKDDGKDNVLWREKLREDVVRDLGLEVVRGTSLDRADNGAALADRLRRAFVRGLRRDEPAAYILQRPRLIVPRRFDATA